MESFQETMQGVLALHPESITVHTLSLKRSARIFQDDSEPFSRDAALAGICWIGAMHSSSNMAMRRIICTGKAGWWATWKTRVGRSRGKRASTMSISWMKRIPYWHAVRVRSRRCGDPYSDQLKRIFNFKYPYEYIRRHGENAYKKRTGENHL